MVHVILIAAAIALLVAPPLAARGTRPEPASPQSWQRQQAARRERILEIARG